MKQIAKIMTETATITAPPPPIPIPTPMAVGRNVKHLGVVWSTDTG